jgi:hypothetical protein
MALVSSSLPSLPSHSGYVFDQREFISVCVVRELGKVFGQQNAVATRTQSLPTRGEERDESDHRVVDRRVVDFLRDKVCLLPQKTSSATASLPYDPTITRNGEARRSMLSIYGRL